MERLWTPWRMQYVSGLGAESGCFLCNAAREDRDAENFVLLRGEQVFALLNLFPYNTAHTLVAPYEHTGDFGALDPATAAELTAMTQRMTRAIGAEYTPDGFNLGLNVGRAAGAGLPGHLHVHVVPRWAGDTNFMTVAGDTKVLPETLDETYARLERRLSHE